ncbi:MAG: hypothetical protein ACRD88_13250 [Terriglobia bacterium]
MCNPDNACETEDDNRSIMKLAYDTPVNLPDTHAQMGGDLRHGPSPMVLPTGQQDEGSYRLRASLQR